MDGSVIFCIVIVLAIVLYGWASITNTPWYQKQKKLKKKKQDKINGKKN